MQETQVLSLGLEDPLVKEMATYSSILAMDRGKCQAPVHGVTRVGRDSVTTPPPPGME